MIVDIATVLFGLGSVAMKVAQAAGKGAHADASEGPGGISLAIGAELATVLFAHHATADIARLREQFSAWLRGNTPEANQDLERAVARSAILADLFCLMKARPGTLEGAERKSWLRCVLERCPVELLGQPVTGAITQGDEARIRVAKADCAERLRNLEEDFKPSPIDPGRLLLEAVHRDYGAGLARDALARLEQDHDGIPRGALPDWVREIFAKQWFSYLCLAFQHELKENQPVFRIFVAMRQEAGFDRVEGAVRDEGQKTRDHIDRVLKPVAAFAYALPALGLFVGREEEREIALGRWLADRAHPLLIWGSPGIGKSKLALGLLHHEAVAARFGPRRYRIRCDPYSSVEAMIAGMGLEWFGLEADPAIAGRVAAKLSEGPAAIVVDNIETPYRADPSGTEEWLQRLLGVPELWLIAGMQGHGRPAGIDWAEPLEPGRLPLAQARELFCGITRVAAHRRDRNLDSLLGDLEGVPHAIELLAHQAVDDDLGELAARWKEERTALLARMGGRSRETSIQVAYEFAIGSPLMSEGARRLLRVLAALPGGLSEADVPRVTETMDGVSPRGAEAVLKQHALAFAEAGRLRMLAPLRYHVQRLRPASREELGAAQRLFVGLAAEGGRWVGLAGRRCR